MGIVSETSPAAGDEPQPGSQPAPTPPTALQARLSRIERFVAGDLLTDQIPRGCAAPGANTGCRWAVAIAALIALQVSVPARLAFQPWWLLPAMEVALFVVLRIANPARITRESTALRAVALAWWRGERGDAVVGGAAGYGLVTGAGGSDPIAAAAQRRGGLADQCASCSALVVLGVRPWRPGGAGERAQALPRLPASRRWPRPELAPPDWEPDFVDYLYLSFTNTTAFSPTDTMPLSRWAKLAMFVQSGISLVLVALVVARAVNTLA